jgi:hypothetical protein
MNKKLNNFEKCLNIDKFVDNQNTVYNQRNNEILYGLNKNMTTLGVSDGTCNQLNPLLLKQNYICGAGVAGGNPCVRDAYGIENFDTSNCSYTKISDYIIFIILTLLLVFMLYKLK